MTLTAACSSAPATETAAPGPEQPPAEPALISPAQAAAARVASVDIRSQGEIRMTVGDTFPVADVRAVALDAQGQPVEGAPPLRHFIATVRGDAAAPQLTPNENATLRMGVVRAARAGRADLVVFQPVPGLEEGNLPPFGVVRLMIEPRPLARVEVRVPDAPLFVGGQLVLDAAGFSDDDSPREDIDYTWRSADPGIASVDPLGVVRGRRVGRATISASAEGITSDVVVQVVPNIVASLTIEPQSASVETGDVVRFRAVARDARGDAIPAVPVSYAIVGGDPRGTVGAAIYEDGAFVAERPGTYQVTATAGGSAGVATVSASPRRGELVATRVGSGIISHTPTSDLWVFRGNDGRDYAYTGTHVGGQKMFAWDVTDPANPILTDSVVVDARVVNDVKVNEAATLAVITREGASNRRNGIVILDLTAPAHPTVLSEYTETVTGGVHNTYIVGDLVYAINDGTRDVHIIDISDPRNPREVGRWGIEREGKYLHDIWVVGGIGYASYWNDGLYILDLGGAGKGGTPTEPIVISSIAYAEGNTHTAFPYTNSDGYSYVFVGDEIFGCEDCVNRVGTHEEGPRGFVHVIDVSDPEDPVEVGRYEVPEAGVHNIWVEDDRLYAAYYQAGLRVVDVSGELRGDLYRQGRELAWFPTGAPPGNQPGTVVSQATTGAPSPFIPNSAFAWGPQPYRGNVFVSDYNSGLWVVWLTPKEPLEVMP
ncbi:MAG TPA: hypothetical protein VMN78_13250 [Longimicrobiales bacterium]|nr:hypothetical protein [Longimicrobiales bacterium]